MALESGIQLKEFRIPPTSEKYKESSAWNPESPAWNPESKSTVQTVLHGEYIRFRTW